MGQRVHTIGGMSPEDFMAYPTPDGRAELVRGELRLMPSPGGRHGALAIDVAVRVAGHVAAHHLGRVFANACFALLDLPRTVRAPDIAFVRADRLPPTGIGPGLLRLAPDLAIEIRSPTETTARLQEKLDDYRVARIPLIWVMDPEDRTVRVIASEDRPRVLRGQEMLEGGTVLPGFSWPVAEVFAGIE